MGLFCFLKFVAMIIDLIIWPLFAIAYPLFVSIWAIESNATAALLKLSRYWVLFSMFLLFEHLHSMILQWFPFWPFFKFVFMCLLLASYFDGASSVYKLIFYEFPTLKFLSNQLIKLKYQAASSAEVLPLHLQASGSAESSPSHLQAASNAESFQTEAETLEVYNPVQDVQKLSFAETVQKIAPPPSTPESSTSEVFEIKKRPMSERISGSFSNGWCTLCTVKCVSESNMISHFYGQKHSEKAGLWCTTCAIRCPNLVAMSSHLNGRRHSKNSSTAIEISTSKLSEAIEKPLSEKKHSQNAGFWCPVCAIRCSHLVAMTSHLNGRKHSENVALWCEVCAIRCPDHIAISRHLNGRKHSQNVS